MQLRNHPFMRNHRLQEWPPVWGRSTSGEAKTVTGELGILQYVHYNPRVSGTCYLVMDFKGEPYVGTLVFENHSVCKIVGDLLSRHLKKTIQEIGDLELPGLI